MAESKKPRVKVYENKDQGDVPASKKSGPSIMLILGIVLAVIVAIFIINAVW